MRAPQLLEQRAVFALEPFLDVFVLGSFPEPLLDHFVSGHVCPSPCLVRTLRSAWICLVSVVCVVGGVGSRRTQSNRGDAQRVLDLPWCGEARGLGKEHRAFRLVLTVAWRRGAEQLAA